MKKMMKSLMAAIGVALLMTGSVFAADVATIGDVEALKAFAVAVNGGKSYEGDTVTLSADLDLTGVEWTPIGVGTRSSKSYTGKAFKGTFDGGNHTISGLTITSTDSDDAAVGLFGVVDGGTVKNLKLDAVNINVASSDLAGGAIGLMVNNAKAENITVGGSIVGNDGVGGIAGRLIISGTISSCTNNASVTSSYGGIGGIVGKAYYEDGANTALFASVDKCVNNGTITAPMYVGGIVGLARANVTGCINNGVVVGGTQTGGIVGQLIAAGTVSNNENNAKISGKNHLGGIIGDYSQTPAYTYYNVTIANNINRGELAATEQRAAILGCNNIDGFTAMTASGNVSFYNAEGLELFGNPEDMVIDSTNMFNPAMTLSDFVQKVVAGNGVFDGNGATVQITPVSGDARTETKEGLPDRLQKYTNPEVYYAQYQRFGNLTDVSISNLKFVFVPAPVTVVDAWNTAGATTTADNINGELQLLNAGNVTFINCSFEKISVSPINATAVSVSGCSFNGLDAYAIKDIKASTVTVADTTFADCNGGFWMNAAPAVLSVIGNTFANVGRRGAIQFSANGDYSSTEMTVTGNNVTGGAFLWQLNPTVTYEQVSAILDTAKNTYGTAYVSGSTEPKPPVARIGDVTYATLEAAFAAATEGQTITLLQDAAPALTSQRAITKAAVIDLGGKTLTLTEDDLYFGTTTFQNGNIVVDSSVKPSTAVFWMFANQTLTFDNVKVVATGVTGTYLIGLDGNNSDLNLLNGSELLVENTTALDLDIICVNASTGNDIVIDNSKINVTNLDGRVLFRGNYTIKGNSEINLEGITKAGIRIEAGQTLSIEDTAKVTIAGEPRDGGIHLTDVTAAYTKADTATVTATINKPYQLSGEGTEASPYLIQNIDDLIFFRDSVNAGETKYSAPGVYVALGADIDLTGVNWEPIGNVGYDNKYAPVDSTKVFRGIFNGNGKIISNLTMTKNMNEGADAEANLGLFGITGEGAVIKNLTITNVTITTDGRNVGALAAFAYKTTLDAITVNGYIRIKGGNNVAGVCAMTRYHAMSATNITVVGNDGSVIEGNNIVGGIFAEIAPNGSAQTFNNLSVENVAINGKGGVGGIVGLLTLGTVENATVKNVAITANTLYNGDAMGRIRMGSVAGLLGGASATIINATVDNVTAKNLDGNAVVLPVIGANYDASSNATEAKIGDKYYATFAKAYAAAQAGETITLLADIAATEVILLDKNLTINGNGHKVTSSATRVFRVTTANTEVTLNGVNIVSTAVRVGTNDIRGISIDIVDNVALTLTNCSVDFTDASANDWAYAVNVTGGNNHILTVNGGIYEGANVINVRGANHTVTVQNATLNSMYPNNDQYYGAGIWVEEEKGSSVTATNNTFNGANAVAFNLGTGTALTESNNIDNTTRCVAKVGAQYYATLAEALAAAQGSENIVIELLADATLDITAWETLAIGGDATETITINGNGKTLTFNKLNSDWNHIVTKNDAKLILNDMTITDSGYNNGPWNRYDINFACDVELNNVTSTKALAFKADATLNDVAVTETNDAYAIWIQSNGQDVAIDGLTVNSAGRGIKIDEQYVDAASKVELSVKDATFTTAKKAAIVVKSAAGADITLENVDISGVAADNVNAVWNDEDSAAVYGNITITGGTLAQEGVANFVATVGKDDQISAYYSDLHAAMVAAKAGDTVKLIADVDLAGKTWEPVSFKGAFDGQNKTISNLTINKPGVSNTGFITSLNGSFKNVIFTNPTVTGGENTGVVAGRAGGSAALAENITINGTIKVETTHSGYARAGGIVGGWGYGNYKNITVDGGDASVSYIKHTGGGDGRYVAGIVGHADDVDSYENCVVKNITISGGWLCGGIAGPGPSDGVATGCAVENIKMNADYSGGMFGWYFGNGTIEDSSIKNVEFTDGTSCNGAIGGYSANPDANVDNVVVENVVNGGKPLLEHVAAIGTTYYMSLQAAVDAAQDGETVALIADVNESIVVAGKAVTLDLNGKTVSGVEGSYDTVYIEDADLTVQDSGKTGKIVCKDGPIYDAVYLGANANFTLNGGTLESDKDDVIYVAGSGSSVAIINGTINGSNALTAWNGASTISGGIITGKLLVQEPATLSVTGGTFTVDPSEFAAYGYGATDNGDGTWTVGVMAKNIFIGETAYLTLDEAFKAATENAVIEIKAAGEYIWPATAIPAGVTVKGAVDGVVATTDGKTIINATILTVENIDFAAHNYAAFISNPATTAMTFTDCSFTPSSPELYAICVDTAAEDAVFTFNNCVFNGFATFTSKVGTLDVNGGEINAGFVVRQDATIDGVEFAEDARVQLGTTDTVTDVNVTITGCTVADTNGDGNVPAVKDLVNETNTAIGSGNVVIVDGDVIYGAVAKIGDTYYETLAAALAAAQDGETVELLWAEGNAPIAMNGSVYGKSVTITGSATVDWSKGFLFVGRGGEGNGTVIFDNANLESASNNASTGIHVSGREKNTNNKYDGTVVINNSTIVLDYLIDKGAMTMTNSTLTVKNGFAVGGRPASETESGVDATATFDLTNGSTLIVNNHNGMGLGYEAIGIMNIDGTSTFKCTQSFLVTGKGALNVAKGGKVEFTGAVKTLTVNGALASAGDVSADIVAGENADIEISGGVYTQDVNEWCVEGHVALKNFSDKYVVGVAPAAEVENLGATTVAAGGYTVVTPFGGSNSTSDPMELPFVMKYVAVETPEAGAASPYADWYGDFVISFSGLKNGSISGAGCYLAGHYGTFGWVKVPVDNLTIENGVRYPVMLSTLGNGQKYDYICGGVDTFLCAMYLPESVLGANPDLKVKLELCVVDNSAGGSAAQQALATTDSPYAYQSAVKEFGAQDFIDVELPEVEVVDIKNTLTDSDPDLTFALNFAIKDMENLTEEYLEKLFAKYGNYYTDYVLTISGLSQESVTFNANGNADGYLAGQYDAWSQNWVSVPFDDVTVENGQSLYIMEYAAKLMGQQGLRFTLAEVAEIVQNFDCGVYFTPEFLAANPDLKVDLELKVFTEDQNGNKINDISVATNTFDKDDFGVAAVVAEDKQTKYFATLQAAVDAAKNGETVNLLATCAENVIVTQNPDIAFTIEGNGNVMTGTITVDGKSSAYPAAGLTIKNIAFDATEITKDASINLGGGNNTRYTSNVTVLDCSFIDSNSDKDKAAVKNYTGGCKNLTVSGCSAQGMHSLIQVKGVAGITVSDIVIVECKNGISVGTSTGVTIAKADIDVAGYGFRADGSGAYDAIVEDCKITAELPVVIRKNTADGYALTLNGENELNGTNGNAYAVVFTNGDDGTYEIPAGNFIYTNNGNEVKVYPVSAYVAEVGGKKYVELEKALKALSDGATLKLLADIEIDGTWDCRFNGAKITADNVKINGNGKTIKLTGTVDDKNWNTVFRFEGKGVWVQNLTLDVSEAKGVQRGITAKFDIAVIQSTFIGNGTTSKYGLIFGEGAGNEIGGLEINVIASTFKDWTYGVADNRNGQDVRYINMDANVFDNANVIVSASKTVYFDNNKMDGGYVNISSYTVPNDLSVRALNSKVDADFAGQNRIVADRIANAYGFLTPVAEDEKGKLYLFLDEAINAGSAIKIRDNINTDSAFVISKQITIDLNGKTIATTENDKSGDGVFRVVDGGDLTIEDGSADKSGTINGVGGNNYNIAVWADGGKVTINGGNFTNVGATDENGNNHFDLIYAKNGGEVVINDGKFVCESPAWTLNIHDGSRQDSSITVNGGTFVGFDPRNNAAETAGTTFMGEGKYTFAEGGNYIVVTPEDYILNDVSSDSATVNEIDSLLAGAVTVTKDGEKYVATATYTFKVTAVDTVNPENSPYELTGGTLRPGKTVAVKYIDLATGEESWDKPESDTVTFKLVIK